MPSRWSEFGVAYPEIYDYIVDSAKGSVDGENILQALIKVVNLPIPLIGIENVYHVGKHGYVFIAGRMVGQDDANAQYWADILNAETASMRVQLVSQQSNRALLITAQARIIDLEAQIAKLGLQSNYTEADMDATNPFPPVENKNG